MKPLTLKPAVRNAILIGGMCSISYFAVYIARNMLSSTSTQMEELGVFSLSQLGTLSSVYFITYACGQLINGWIGDRIKAKYMISFGLILAGLCNAFFSLFADVPLAAYICYAISGLFLSMIYGPMTKVVAENTEPIYATRCSLGYTFASFIGTPSAGVIAMAVTWYAAFYLTAASLILMGIVAMLSFTILEQKGIITYRKHVKPTEKVGSIKILLERQILKFTVISIVTGVVRTAVVFWLPTYLAQHLNFSSKTATLIYTVSTFIISFTTFIAVLSFKYNLDRCLLIFFSAASILFLLVLLIPNPAVNIILLVLAIMASNSVASMMWCRYCPSLRDTGMVSTATGYLDFISYMSAAASSSIFANAVDNIGWSGLILVWVGLMLVGVSVCLPRRKQ